MALCTLLFTVQAKELAPEPVTGFDVKRYVGTWYEIARLDHWFEKNHERVAITYTLMQDGGLRVKNESVVEGEAKESQGWMHFQGEKSLGSLKVSFFRPFYNPYIIFKLDPDYRYAFVAGEGSDYLWFLSRTKTVSKSLKQDFIRDAKDYGFKIEDLIWVKHF